MTSGKDVSMTCAASRRRCLFALVFIFYMSEHGHGHASFESFAQHDSEWRALAPFFNTTWNFVGCSTGRLAGFAPLMILST